jgi:hypothetical protein
MLLAAHGHRHLDVHGDGDEIYEYTESDDRVWAKATVTMATIYRISQPGREPVVDAGTVEAIEGTIGAGGPGCYHIDEISSDVLPSGHTSRRWGKATWRPDGVITLDPDPWPDR